MLTDRSRIARSLCSALAIATATLVGAQAHAQSTAPNGSFQGTGTFNSGSGSITLGTNTTTINVTSPNAVIDWSTFDTATGGGPINFQPSSTTATFQSFSNFSVLNRILPTDPSRAVQFNGNVVSQIQGSTATPGGTVYFYSPGGVIVGSTAVFNVGNLGLTSIAPAVVGGVFEQTGTNGKFVQLNGAVRPGSAVSVQAGAQITGSGSANGNFVGIVAPVVDQRGTINVNGIAALVSADAATITFRLTGLLDIQVTSGTSGTGATLVNTGTITGPAFNGTGAPHRIYAVAVPKNDAITMILGDGGSLGFDIAGAANITGNAVVLSAGHNIADGQIVATPSAGGGSGSVMIDSFNAKYTSEVVARATGRALFASDGTVGLGSTSFAANLTAHSATIASVEARSGGSANVTGNLALDANAFAATPTSSVVAGNAYIDARNGASLTVGGNAVLEARAQGGNATGGNANATAMTNGTISVGGVLRVRAEGFGGSGGSGTGGTATLNAGTGGDIVANQLNVSTDGVGGADAGTGAGNGRGGDISLVANGTGSTISIANGNTTGTGRDLLFVTARGFGGQTNGGGSGVGGAAVGGNVTIQATDGATLTGPANGGSIGFIRIFARAFGGDASVAGSTGGQATGGNINITVDNASFTSADLLPSSFAQAGSALPTATGTINGGNAIGGTRNITVRNGATMTSSFSGGGPGAQGGDGSASGRGGDASGGSASLVVDAATLTLTGHATVFSQNAPGSGGTTGNVAAGTAFGQVSNGAVVNVFNDTASTNDDFSITANALGALSPATPGTAQGTVTAGTATLLVQGGTIQGGGSVTVGAGAFAQSDQYAQGGTFRGGTASVQVQGGTISTSQIFVSASAEAAGVGAGFNGSGGSAIGGSAIVQATAGSTSLTSVSIEANGHGGSAGTAGGNGGDGTGGSATFSALPGGTVSVSGTTDLSASGSGGTALANGASAGTGRGGTARILVQSTGAMTLGSNVSLDASGHGGFNENAGIAGGAGIGGLAEIRLENAVQAGALTTTTVTVPGTANPFLAGQPNGATALGDTAPAQSPTLALSNFDPSQPITVSAVGGFNFSGGTPAASADGDGGLGNMNAGVNGISGPQNIMFNSLVGVFLANTVPSGTAPAQRNDALNYTSVSPSLQQIFSVGDGLTGTGTGTQQTIVAPSSATRFYLGAADGSGWFNNSGTSTVTINYTSLSTTLTGLATLNIGGSLTATASGTGSGGNNANGGNGIGGSARITADAVGKTITVAGATTLIAEGLGGAGVNGRGGEGTGGNALILASAGGLISLPGSSAITALDASGIGGSASGIGDGGNGSSGIARVFVNGGTITVGGDLNLFGDATGGDGINGGNAISSRPDLQPRALIGSSNGTVNVAGTTLLSSAAFGGTGAFGGKGGDANGGFALVEAQNNIAGASSISLRGLVASANAFGGVGGVGVSNGVGGAGGNAFAGNVQIFAHAGNGQLTVTAPTFLNALGFGGAGGQGGSGTAPGTGGVGGTGIGGATRFGTRTGIDTGAINTGSASFASVQSFAHGAGGSGGAGGVGTVQGAGGAGGAAFNGAAAIAVRGAQVTFNQPVTLGADATGGAGGAGSTAGAGGNATVGTDPVLLNGGGVFVAVINRDQHPEQPGRISAVNITGSAMAVGGTGSTPGASLMADLPLRLLMTNSTATIGTLDLRVVASNVSAAVLPSALALTGSTATISNLSLSTSGPLSVSLDTSTLNVGNLALSAGNFVLPATRPATLGTINVSGSLTLSSMRDFLAYANFNGAGSAMFNASGSVLTGDATFGGSLDLIATGSITLGNVQAANVTLNAGAALATGAIVSGGDIDLVAGGSATTGQLTAGNSATVQAVGAINVAGATAGIVNPSTIAGADYTVALRSLASITAGALTARANVGLSSPGSITVGNIAANQIVLALAGTGLTAGSITTLASGRTYLANFSMEALGGQITQNFDPAPILAASPVAIAGPIAINGAVSTGSLRAAATGAINVGAITSSSGTFLSGRAGITSSAISAGQTIALFGGTGPIAAGNLQAGDSITVSNAGSVTLGNLSAGLVQPSTSPNALYRVVVENTGGSVTTGNIAARRDVGIQAPQAITTGDISGRDVLLLPGTSLTTGSITALNGTQPSGRVYIGNYSMASTANGFVSSIYTNLPLFNLEPIRTGGPITINGAVVAGSLFASTAQGITLQAVTAGTATSLGFIDIDAGGLATINGRLAAARKIDIASRDIDITATGSLDGLVALSEIELASNNPNGAFIGDGLTTTSGYMLSNAEYARLKAGQIAVVGDNQAELATDMTIGNLAIAGSQLYGAGGVALFATGNRTTETPGGTLRIAGVVTASGFAATNEVDLLAGTVELETAKGSLKLSDGSGALGGFVYIEADRIHVADDAILTKLRADPLYSGRISDLNAPAAVQRTDGVLNALGVEIRPGSTFYIQNTGTRTVPAGFLTTLDASDIIAPSRPPTEGVSIVINGQFQTATGNSTGTSAFSLVKADPTPDSEQFAGFSSDSQLNGCVFLSGVCAIGQTDPVAALSSEITVVTNATLDESPVAPTADDSDEGDEGSGEQDDEDSKSDEGSSPIAPPAPLISTRALDGNVNVVEPVSGAGNPALFGSAVDETTAQGEKP